MKHRFLLTCLLLAAARPVRSAELPPADAFFRPDTFVMPQLSPDGRRLTAMILHDGRHYALALIDPQTRQVDVLVKDKVASVVFSSWQTDDLLIFMTEANNGRTWIQSLDLRTRKVNGLDRLNREGRAQVWVGDDSRFVVCTWVDGGIRRVDVRTGKAEEVERAVRGINRWVFDAKGVPWRG